MICEAEFGTGSALQPIFVLGWILPILPKSPLSRPFPVSPPSHSSLFPPSWSSAVMISVCFCLFRVCQPVVKGTSQCSLCFSRPSVSLFTFQRRNPIRSSSYPTQGRSSTLYQHLSGRVSLEYPQYRSFVGYRSYQGWCPQDLANQSWESCFVGSRGRAQSIPGTYWSKPQTECWSERRAGFSPSMDL